MFKILWLPGLIVAAGCGAEGSMPVEPVDPGGPGEQLGRAVVTGRVTDGLLGTELSGVRMSVGPIAVVSDSNGQFRASGVPQGEQLLLVDTYGYETYHDTIDVITSHHLHIGLTRQAPAVTVCQADSSGIHAWIVDLQGRKSVDRRFATQVSIGGPGATRHLTGNDLDWQWLDDFTWRVDIPGVLAPRNEIHWRVVDDDGFHGIMSCDEASDQTPTDPGELM